MSLTYSVIRDPEVFLDLSDQWNTLLETTAVPHLFQRWEWHYSWWQSFGGELFIVRIDDGATLTALFPWIRKRHRPLFIGPWQCDELLPIGAPDSDNLGPLISSGREKEIMGYLFETVLAETVSVTIVGFEEIHQDDPLIHLKDTYLPRAWMFRPQQERICPYLPLPDSYDTCLAERSASFRASVRRKHRRLYKQHDVTFGVVPSPQHDPETLEIHLDAFIRQHQARWQGRDRPGAFATPEREEFMRRVARRLCKSGHLRLNYLSLDGQPVASYCLFHWNRRRLFYLSGFDPSYGHLSPGSVLLANAIHQAIDEKCTEFDFMRGTASFKYHWTDRVRRNQSWTLLKRTPLTLLLLGRRWCVRRLALLIKRFIPHTLKSVIRSRLPNVLIKAIDPWFR
ncbi:MAG: GNAT family N-acetyltransferase [Magnetococcales bacterium]|nr:GNAT family N-acetyltransferase [Magnetococcales bacterium]